MTSRLPDPVVRSLGDHLAQVERQHQEDLARERLRGEYKDDIDWGDVINRTEATMAMAEQVMAMVYQMPDCPARRKTIQMLDAAAESYAQEMMKDAA